MKIDLARIRAEAAILANEKGLDGLSMNDLAAALKVRTPSLYSHVAGIAEVKRLLALHGLAELERGAARSTIGKSGRDAVRVLLTGYREFVRKNPGLYAATLPTPDPADTEWRDAVQRLSETCSASMQGYGLGGPQAIHALRGLRSVVHGFASLEAAGAMRSKVDRDESFVWLVDAFLIALEQMGAKPPSQGDPPRA